MHFRLYHIRMPGAGDQAIDAETGCRIPFHDDDALSDRIRRLITDSTHLHKMSTHARNSARTEFSRDAIGDRIERVYMEVSPKMRTCSKRQTATGLKPA